MQSCSLSSLLFAGWTGPYRRAAQGLLLALCSGIPLPLPPFLAEGGRSMARWLQRACPESVRPRVQPLVHTRALSTSSCRWEPGATGWVIPKEQAQEANCKPSWKRQGCQHTQRGHQRHQIRSDITRARRGQRGSSREGTGQTLVPHMVHWQDSPLSTEPEPSVSLDVAGNSSAPRTELDNYMWSECLLQLGNWLAKGFDWGDGSNN